MTIFIEQVPAYPQPATQLRVDDGHIILDGGADFTAALLDAGGNGVSQPIRVALTDTQYDEWGLDDTWAATCVAQNMGLTPI